MAGGVEHDAEPAGVAIAGLGDGLGRACGDRVGDSRVDIGTAISKWSILVSAPGFSGQTGGSYQGSAWKLRAVPPAGSRMAIQSAPS